MHTMPKMPKSPKCDKPACMSCVVSFMKTYLDYTHSNNGCHNHDNYVHKRNDKSKTVSPPKVRKEAPFTKFRSKTNDTYKGDRETVNENVKHAEDVKNARKFARYSYASKFCGLNMVWVPKKS